MIGQVIHNYTIVSKLGQGGMGTVYKAVDNVLGREVALKMLNTEMLNQPQVLERFKKEAQVLARLLHPNIAVIYNLIEQDQQHFMVIEYVEGKNLDELLKQYKAVPYEMVVLIFIQALEGLHHAHRKGIFHRDIKPSNLILTPYGTVKLMDFGIAKVAGEQRMTQVNRVIGTVEFLAPEIIEGKEPSEASDIYAAGVTMYELLTGKLPFESSTDFNLMQEILKKKPIAVDKLNAAVPKSLSAIIMRALEKKPEQRFADAGAFRQALIAAFPELRSMELTTLSKQLDAASAAPLTQVLSMPRNASSVAAPTRLESVTRPADILKTLNEKVSKGLQTISGKYLSTKRSRIIAGIVFLFLFVLLGFAIFSKSDNKPVAGGGGPVASDSIAKTETVTAEQKQTGGTVAPQEQRQPQQPTEQVVFPAADDPVKPVTDQPGQDQDQKEKARKEKERKDQERRDQEKKDAVKAEEEKREQDRIDRERKEQENKNVSIRSNDVSVSLYLQQNPESIPKRQETPVHFTVSRPVVYNGVTIIRQGATANGVIRVGMTRIDVTINGVTAANGQQVRLRVSEEHRNIREFTSNRNYSANVVKGTNINF